jgi:hypothetical protein
VVIPPQVPAVEVVEVVEPPAAEINYFTSDEEEEDDSEDEISFITLSSVTI